VDRQLTTLDRVITKKEEIIEKQIRILSDESDSLSSETQTLKDTEGKLETKQVGLLLSEIGGAQTTYSRLIALVRRLLTFIAMDVLAVMKKSRGESI